MKIIHAISMIGLIALSSEVTAFPTPPSNSLIAYAPGTFLRFFNGTQLIEHVTQTGQAAADSPICVASGQTAGPCNIVMDLKVTIDTKRFTGVCSGTINVVTFNTTSGVPLNEITASYPFQSNEDFSTILTTGAATFTGHVNIPGKGSIPLSGYTLIAIPCGPNTYCYADGTFLNIGDLNSPTNAPVKVLINF